MFKKQHLNIKNINLLIFLIICNISLYGQTSRFVFDRANRLLQIDNGNCSGIKYVYDANGNRLSTNKYSITITDSIRNETCPHANDGSITLVSPGNFSYLWNTGQITPMINNLSPATYTVIIKDNTTGTTCSKSFKIIPQFIDSFSVHPKNVSCYHYGDGQGTIQIEVRDLRSTYTYNWKSATDTSYSSVNNISNLEPGNYSVSIRNSYTGCIKTLPFTITQPSPLITGIQKNDNPCFGMNKANAVVNVSGNPSQYSYLWTSTNFTQPQTTQQINSIANGNYYVAVSENFGNACKMNDTVTIIGPTKDNLIDIVIDSATCLGTSGGSATAEVLGNTSEYVYQWFNNTANTYLNQTTSTVTGLEPGNYTLTIISRTIDSCKSTKSFRVSLERINAHSLLFPNPTTGLINIIICTENNSDITYSIYTALGQLLKTNTSSVNGRQVLQIDLSAYERGTYFIKLFVNNQSTTLKAIKL